MTCADCHDVATVFRGSVALCGTCFYNSSARSRLEDEPSAEVLRRRVAETLTAVDELVREIREKIGNAQRETLAGRSRTPFL